MPAIQLQRDIPGVGPSGFFLIPNEKEVTGIWVTDQNGDPVFLHKGDYALVDGSGPSSDAVR